MRAPKLMLERTRPVKRVRKTRTERKKWRMGETRVRFGRKRRKRRWPKDHSARTEEPGIDKEESCSSSWKNTNIFCSLFYTDKRLIFEVKNEIREGLKGIAFHSELAYRSQFKTFTAHIFSEILQVFRAFYLNKNRVCSKTCGGDKVVKKSRKESILVI